MTQRTTVRKLLDEYGRTHAEEAGIRLRDTPMPLYQLLTLCVLFSVRIKADIAVAAARELFAAGMRTPRTMAASSWQDRVDALGRAHYRRYDESTATALGDGSELVLDRYRGDLRRLRDAADRSPDRIRDLLREVPRIGPVGTDIFCRETQGLWPELRPAFDTAGHATPPPDSGSRPRPTAWRVSSTPPTCRGWRPPWSGWSSPDAVHGPRPGFPTMCAPGPAEDRPPERYDPPPATGAPFDG